MKTTDFTLSLFYSPAPVCKSHSPSFLAAQSLIDSKIFLSKTDLSRLPTYSVTLYFFHSLFLGKGAYLASLLNLASPPYLLSCFLSYRVGRNWLACFHSLFPLPRNLLYSLYCLPIYILLGTVNTQLSMPET